MKTYVLSLLLLLPLHAAVIGTSQAAESLTVARINAILPPAQRRPWLDYLNRSEAQMIRDKAVLTTERSGLEVMPPLPKQSNSARSIPLDRDAVFYKSAEARHIGDVILSFQTPAGGWSKNLDMACSPRLRGQSYATANLAPVASGAGDFDEPRDEHWHYVGTLDNDATNTELHFLAELSAAFPGKDGDSYRTSVLRGVEYLLLAQFPNGGWPQVWPLEGGYHDAITFNDDAVTESAEVLQDSAEGKSSSTLEDWSFVPAETRNRAKTAVANALQCILATQVRVPAAGTKRTVLTIWAQQHDALTLVPVAGRNFEPAALSAGESASVMQYLMRLRQPSPDVRLAIQSAAGWFLDHEIRGYVWTGGRGTPGGRQLVAKAGASQLWARYYSIQTGQPIFGDRDKSIHDNVSELSLERRNGYGWYGDGPQKALEQYLNKWEPQFHRAHAGL